MNNRRRPYLLEDPHPYQQNMPQRSSDWNMPMYQQNMMGSPGEWNNPMYENNMTQYPSDRNMTTYQQNMIQHPSDRNVPMGQYGCNNYYGEGTSSSPFDEQQPCDNDGNLEAPIVSKRLLKRMRKREAVLENRIRWNMEAQHMKMEAQQLEIDAKRYFEGQSDYNPYKWYKRNAQSNKPPPDPVSSTAHRSVAYTFSSSKLHTAEKDENMLQYGVKPSKKIAILMAHVFGHIFRDIRKNKANYKTVKVTMVKEILRSRIYDLMVDKPFTEYMEVVNAYRTMYPTSPEVEFYKLIKKPIRNKPAEGN